MTSTFFAGDCQKAKRAEYVEAVKGQLIRDRSFFEQIEEKAEELAQFEENVLEQVIRKSAALHLDHIASSETPSKKAQYALHWTSVIGSPTSSATFQADFRMGHGDAVAIGLAVDRPTHARVGLIKPKTAERCLRLLERLGFHLYDDLLHTEGESGNRTILEGLEEFREHLGGELTITLVQGIGEGVEVHAMDKEILESAEDLQRRHEALLEA